jgi:hypothetical protein
VVGRQHGAPPHFRCPPSRSCRRRPSSRRRTDTRSAIAGQRRQWSGPRRISAGNTSSGARR